MHQFGHLWSFNHQCENNDNSIMGRNTSPLLDKLEH